MADFPSTLPPDVVEINTYIRWWLGNLSTSVISDADMNSIIQRNITVYVDDLCKITYYSTIDVLSWLVRANTTSDGSSGAAGSVTRRREKRGKTEIEVEYSESASSGSVGWDKVLEDLRSDPSTIGCDPFSDVDNKIRAPIIGGADVNGYQESFRSRGKFGAAIRESRYSCNRRLF